MKRVLLSSLLICTGILNAQQPFGTTGTWHISEAAFGYLHVYEVSYEKDSTYNGQTYQALAVGGLNYITTGPNSSNTSVRDTSYILLRTQNDTVFRLSADSTEYVLYDFSAGVGDSWVIGPVDSILACTDTPKVTVTAIGFDTINGFALKYWEVESGSGMGWRFPRGRIYERMGFIAPDTNIFFKPVPQNCNSNVSVDFAEIDFRCYQDVDVGFYSPLPSNMECNYVPGVGLMERVVSPAFNMAPNPSSGSVSVQANRDFDEIEIYNLQGQKVQSHQIEKRESFDLELNIPPGLYLVVVKGGGKRLGLEKLTIQ